MHDDTYIFGVIAAENIEYAAVSSNQAVARGDAECRVIIYLKPKDLH